MVTGSHIIIYGNNIANLSESGITINSGTNNCIYENSLSYNRYAIRIRNINSTIFENDTFYHNNFLNNTQTVQVESPNYQNVWDNGSEGNYWSDYNGTNNNGDGIGDTSYVINENNIDRFPLITPYKNGQTLQSNQMQLVYLGIIGLIIFSLFFVTTSMYNRRKPKLGKAQFQNFC